MRLNKSSVVILIFLFVNRILVGLRKVVNRVPISYTMLRVYVSFLHNSLVALRSKSMLLRENNSNDILYIARVRTRVEDKVISINETDEMDKADQSDRIGRKTDTGKIAFSCHPNAIRPSCLMPIVRHLSSSLTPSLTSQLAFANKVLIFINIVYES